MRGRNALPLEDLSLHLLDATVWIEANTEEGKDTAGGEENYKLNLAYIISAFDWTFLIYEPINYDFEITNLNWTSGFTTKKLQDKYT